MGSLEEIRLDLRCNSKRGGRRIQRRSERNSRGSIGEGEKDLSFCDLVN
jgi:hypothetical protein